MEVKAVRATLAECLPYLEHAAEFDTSGGVITLGDICDGSAFFLLQADGKTVGGYAVKLARYERASIMWVQSASANLPGAELSPHILSIVEQQARQLGADQIAFATRRRGAVKKLLKAGYGHESVILRKNLK